MELSGSIKNKGEGGFFLFHYTVDSSRSISDTIQALEQSLAAEQFGILWQLNIKDTLHKKGYDYGREYVVLEVCNPQIAHLVLSKNHMVGYFLPCKIVVYEEDGKVKVGMPKPSVLINMVGDHDLKVVAQDVENRLKKCIEQAI
jgi:uncharacterized protein (DUF302 family)